MMRVSWIVNGSTYSRVEGEVSNVETIPKGIYEIEFSPLSGWSLYRTADNFVFTYKLYNLQRGFIDHVKRTYANTKGNLGILFNGTRGTGKTVTAKILANELNLPVIIVKSMGDNNSGLISYLSSFNFDCIFFFDEFEKQFSENDCSVLQIMDGVYNSNFRKIFLLTTNQLSVNENLLSRPSRIRYIREFGNLEKSVVEEYLDDNLKDNEGRDELLDYIDTLTISTIDILKAIVEEVNIHGIKAFLEIKKIFNVTCAHYDYRTIYGSISEKIAKGSGYNVTQFLNDVENFKNRYTINQEYHKLLSSAKDDQEYHQIEAKFEPLLCYKADIDYGGLTQSEKAWNKLIPNVDYFDGDIVIKVSLENNVIVTTHNERLYYYLLENPNEKPSLYTRPIGKDYGYLM